MTETKKSIIKDGSFVIIHSWMISELNLKNTELIIYACIYGFTASNGSFSGSHSFLADFANCSRRQVINCLVSLIKKGFVNKQEEILNGVKFCSYESVDLEASEKRENESKKASHHVKNAGQKTSHRVKKVHGGVKKVYRGCEKTSQGGCEKTSHNNIEIDNIDNNIFYNIEGERTAHARGEYENVYMSDEEYEKLKSEYPSDYVRYINKLSEHIKVTGREYSSHYATVRKWLRDDALSGTLHKKEEVRYNEQGEAIPKYSNVSAEEAFRRAIARTYAEFDDLES